MDPENMDLEGTARSFVQVPYQRNVDTAELLTGFLFRFTDGDDHPLQMVGAHHPVDAEFVEAAFTDRDISPNDPEFYYHIIAHKLSDPRIVLKSTTMPSAFGNYVLIDENAESMVKDYEFVLCGFKFWYHGLDRGDDFAIKKIAVEGTVGAISVEFHDRSGTNHFGVTVDYAYVPRDCFHSDYLRARVVGESQGPGSREMPAGIAVFRGFSLEYTDDDFRMLQLGMFLATEDPQDPHIDVFFSDRGLQNRFNWSVDYLLLN